MGGALAKLFEHFPLRVQPSAPVTAPRWGQGELVGRLTELSGQGASAVLTLAFSAVLDAQLQGETVAWVSAGPDLFHPPDVDEGGVDLAALAVIRADGVASAARVADKLLRSGAFGLVVIDLAQPAERARAVSPAPEVPIALLARLVKLAQKHEAAVLCLTDKGPLAHSLGSLVSLRCEATRSRLSPDLFSCDVHVLKDKKRGPGWRWSERCRGPAGLL